MNTLRIKGDRLRTRDIDGGHQIGDGSAQLLALHRLLISGCGDAQQDAGQGQYQQ